MKSQAVSESTPPRRRLLRVVLLVVLAFGVFGMHTFGHPPGVGPAVPSHPTIAHQMNALPAPEQGRDSSRGPGRGLHAFTVCLAVVGGAVVLISLSMLRRRRCDLPLSAGAQPWATGRRRSPARRLIGLRLTAVSVVRT